jgi:transposase-like protein
MSVHVDEFQAIDPESLTEKQAMVLQALREGKTPKQIARKMKITSPGVYAHIRALTKHAASANGGVPTQTAPSTNGNGRSHPNGVERSEHATVGGFETAVETLQQALLTEQEILSQSEGRIAQAQGLIKEAQTAIEAESDEIARRAALIEALENAKASLSTVAV